MISVVVSVLVEVYYYRREHNISSAGYNEVKDLELITQVEAAVPVHQSKKMNPLGNTTDDTTTNSSSSLTSSSSSEPSANTMNNINTSSEFLKVTYGRPSTSVVIEDIVKAQSPGVYLCGPRSLLDAIGDTIREKRNDCAIYQEDSEM